MPVNFSDATPAAPAGNTNVSWQKSGTNVSAYVPNVTTGQPYDMGAYLPGKPDAGAALLKYKFPRAVTFADHFAGSKGNCDVNPTASAECSIQKNGVECGTMTIGTNGVYVFVSESGPVPSFAENDIITVLGPNPQDATLEGVGFSLKGTR